MARFDELDLPIFVHDGALTPAEAVREPRMRRLLIIAAIAPAGLEFILKVLRKAEASVDDVEFRRDIKRLDRLAVRHRQAYERWLAHVALVYPEWSKQVEAAQSSFLARYGAAPLPLQLAVAAAYEYVVTCHLAVYTEAYTETSDRPLQRSGLGPLLRWQARVSQRYLGLAHRLAGELELGYVLRMRAYLRVLGEVSGRLRGTVGARTWRDRMYGLFFDRRARHLLRALVHYIRPSFGRTAEQCNAALAH